MSDAIHSQNKNIPASKFFSKHQYLKKIIIPILSVILSIIIFYGDIILNLPFGNFINLFFPCTYSPSEMYNSAPCSLKYDTTLAIALATITITSILYITIISIIHLKNKNINR